MSQSNYKLTKDFFHATETKNVSAAIALFNIDAEFIDPHYPNEHMKGKKEITEGLTWGFNGLKKLGFIIDKYFESDDGTSLAVEITTDHILPNGNKLNFPQVFIIDVKGEKISRLRAYEPYGPHGLVGIMLSVTRSINKFSLILATR